MKTFTVTIVDSQRFMVYLHLEASNAATLEHGLNMTLGMAGCEIIKIEEYAQEEY
jgi:hypothetical protein